MLTQEKNTLKQPKEIKVKFDTPTDVFKLFGLSQFPYCAKISFLPLIEYWEDRLLNGNQIEQLIADKIHKLLNGKSKLLKQAIDDRKLLDENKELIEFLTSVYFPHENRDAMVRLTGPFNTHPFFHSESLKEILKKNTVTTNLDMHPKRVYQFIIYRAGCMILNKYYAQNLHYDTPYVFSINDEKTKLIKHFKTNIDNRFSTVNCLSTPNELSNEQIHDLLSNVEDTELWLKYLPPSNFEFEGVFCSRLTDTTDAETLSQLKEGLLQREALIHADKIQLLEKNLRTFFKQPDLRIGVFSIKSRRLKGSAKKRGIKHGLITDKFPKPLSQKYKGSIYARVVGQNDFIVVENLLKYSPPTPLEAEILERGFRSFLAAPLTNKYNQVIGILELANPIAFKINSLSALKLKSIVSLFNVAIERSQAEVNNQIEAIIREHFTAIHPSVEWAFIDNAYKILQAKNGNNFIDDDRFVFTENYPLYGQSDIVGSTVTRNKAIQSDLINNFYQIKKLLVLSIKYYDFPLAEQAIQEVDHKIQRLKTGISSNTEYELMKFIRKEINPLIRYLKKKHPILKKAFSDYCRHLDPRLQTVYKKRKDYEKSVSIINRLLSSYLDKQQEKAQEMCPHYYEKFQTDGVAYNIYVGQSLLRKGKFTPFHLKNLRLWQLISMCDITRKVAAIQSQLPIPLNTAQLILVHSTPLSIRFRMDEKRFDVDGAYNARYEIIKKRIDKALIEGTNERLTVSGKVAIVYQNEKDRKEYMRYLGYLVKKGYIEKSIEELQLKKLQGIQGLRALRINVIL